MDLKSDSSGRGWLHIDPGQSESGSTLATSVDVGRIQGVRLRQNYSTDSSTRRIFTDGGGGSFSTAIVTRVILKIPATDTPGPPTLSASRKREGRLPR